MNDINSLSFYFGVRTVFIAIIAITFISIIIQSRLPLYEILRSRLKMATIFVYFFHLSQVSLCISFTIRIFPFGNEKSPRHQVLFRGIRFSIMSTFFKFLSSNLYVVSCFVLQIRRILFLLFDWRFILNVYGSRGV